MNSDRYFFWLKAALWTIVVLLPIFGPIRVWQADMSRAEEANAERVKAQAEEWGLDKLTSIRDELVTRMQATPKDPMEFFKINDTAMKWSDVMNFRNQGIHRMSGEALQKMITLRLMQASLPQQIGETRQRYDQAFPRLLTAIDKEYVYEWRASKTEISPELWPLCKQTYAFWVLLTYILFLVRFWEQEALAVLFSRKRLAQSIGCALLGPIGAIKFKPEISAQELTSAFREVAWVFSSVLAAMLGLFGAPMAKAQTLKASDSGKGSGKSGKVQPEDDEASAPKSGSVVDTAAVLRRFSLKHLAVELFKGQQDNLDEVTAEYAWSLDLGKSGKAKSFGFFQWRHGESTQTFNNHNVSWYPWGKVPVALFSEAGSVGNKPFVSSGLRVDLDRVPGISKPLNKGKLKQFSATYVQQVNGAAPERQIILAFGTNEYKFSLFGAKDSIKVWGEGFQRLRPGKAGAYGQWQALVELFGFKTIRAVIQCDVTSRLVGCSFGVKIYPLRR